MVFFAKPFQGMHFFIPCFHFHFREQISNFLNVCHYIYPQCFMTLPKCIVDITVGFAITISFVKAIVVQLWWLTPPPPLHRHRHGSCVSIRVGDCRPLRWGREQHPAAHLRPSRGGPPPAQEAIAPTCPDQVHGFLCRSQRKQREKQIFLLGSVCIHSPPYFLLLLCTPTTLVK